MAASRSSGPEERLLSEPRRRRHRRARHRSGIATRWSARCSAPRSRCGLPSCHGPNLAGSSLALANGTCRPTASSRWRRSGCGVARTRCTSWIIARGDQGRRPARVHRCGRVVGCRRRRLRRLGDLAPVHHVRQVEGHPRRRRCVQRRRRRSPPASERCAQVTGSVGSYEVSGSKGNIGRGRRR